MRIASGNEAIAWAAAKSGIDYFANYPGSPVNKVDIALKAIDAEFDLGIKFDDSLNEHVATLAAAGASYCGAKSMVVMKHVGLNIASDPLNYINYTGVKGGMVIVVGTDPGAGCSTNEEDAHWYIAQSGLPLIEPTSLETIYEDTCNAFTISVETELPVCLFIPARLCNSIGAVPDDVTQSEKREFAFTPNRDRYINVGARAIANHKRLNQKMEELSKGYSYEATHFNERAEVGIIARGLTANNVFETIKKFGLEQSVHLYTERLVYPLNKDRLRSFVQNKKEIIFIEDQDGFLENQVKMQLFSDLPRNVSGKEHFPPYGEIDRATIESYFSERFTVSTSEHCVAPAEVSERLGVFCDGCPHRTSYYAIKEMTDNNPIVGGDIGCSSLPPFLADWLMCMNAGIGVSQGMAKVLNNRMVVSTGGDGSFFHTGLMSLQNAIHNNTDIVHIVFDNQYIAMTGHQKGVTLFHYVSVKKLLKSIGVKRVYRIDSHMPKKIAKVIMKEQHTKGVKVIWIDGVCQKIPNPFTELKKKAMTLTVKNEKCGDCRACYETLACPAIYEDEKGLYIDADRCIRCGACHIICPNHAIGMKFDMPFHRIATGAAKVLIQHLTRKWS